jgi:8-oxo-dGTP pyrophosphatase MutT (NUDIX family)
VSFDLETLRRQLRGRKTSPKQRGGQEVGRRAAVAAVLRPVPGDTEVLLIRRAERPGDPWSGHMALPGGHHEPGDADLRQTAIRETLEEVGLDLRGHDYLGQLDELAATARGKLVGMTISPYVFVLSSEPPPLRPNYEVAELIWGSLGRMFRGEVDALKELTYGGEMRRLPAFDVQGHLVWGMTHSMLRSLFALLREREERVSS